MHKINKSISSPAYAIIFALISGLVVLIPIEQKAVALVPIISISPYKSGYAQGCPDGQNGNHSYLVASGGPSGHADMFMRGYNDGYSFCSNSGGGVGSESNQRTR